MAVKVEISYATEGGPEHKAVVVIKDAREKIQSIWLEGNFYEVQRHGMLNYAYQKFRGGTFIDIGASIGNHSLFFALCCQADRVLAFEPVEEIFNHLEENVRANNLENIHAWRIALGSEPGEVGMNYSSMPAEEGGMMNNTVNEAGAGVRIDTLDRVLAGESVGGVKCIKIDVEGYAVPVLKGAYRTIERCRPAVFCECETEAVYKEVDSFFSGLGYEVWEVEGEPFIMNRTPTYLWEHKTNKRIQ